MRAVCSTSASRPKPKTRANPLDVRADGAASGAGLELYKKNCEVCHAYDGSGKTAVGGGLYPRPADLRRGALARRSDGDLFYLIRNGSR